MEWIFFILSGLISIFIIFLMLKYRKEKVSNDQPTSSNEGADRQQIVVAPATSVETANRSMLLSETEVQLEKLALDDTQPPQRQKKQSDACADDGEEAKKNFFELARRGGAARMRAMLNGPNADVLLSAKVDGVTALSVAVQKGNSEVVELLRAEGAMDEMSPVKFDGETININFALTPANRWDSAACLEVLTLFEPDRLIVETNGLFGDSDSVSFVFAERPIPKNFGIFYYEVNILKLEKNKFFKLKSLYKKGFVSIGLATKQRLQEGPYVYESIGTLYRHGAMPTALSAKWFGVGDVVGCGVDLANSQLFFTKNGARLDTADLFVSSAADLFPFVAFWGSTGKIEANFGPNFKYKFQ